MPASVPGFLKHSFLAAAIGLTPLLVPVPLLAQNAPPVESKPAADASDLYKSTEGPFDAKIIDENWHDEGRNRTVPVRIYLPEPRPAQTAPIDPAPSSKHPIIIFSPGLGGSRIVYGYFGRHMASHGYIVITITHAGSDTAAAIAFMRGQAAQSGNENKPKDAGAKSKADDGWLMSSVNDPDSLRNRPKDISFAIDQIATHKILGPIADTQRIGVAGHSFGAYTAMAIGGMTVDLPESHGGKAQSFRDPRVKAVLPMSPEGSGVMGITAAAWEKFGTPVLFLTGTLDYGAGGRSAAWRRQAYDAVHTVDDYLITIAGAGHMTFASPEGKIGPYGPGMSIGSFGGLGGLGDGGGTGLGVRRERGEGGKTPDAGLIRSLSVGFFDAYLRDDAKAAAWLHVFCMKKRADSVGEFKPAPK